MYNKYSLLLLPLFTTIQIGDKSRPFPRAKVICPCPAKFELILAEKNLPSKILPVHEYWNAAAKLSTLSKFQANWTPWCITSASSAILSWVQPPRAWRGWKLFSERRARGDFRWTDLIRKCTSWLFPFRLLLWHARFVSKKRRFTKGCNTYNWLRYATLHNYCTLK